MLIHTSFILLLTLHISEEKKLSKIHVEPKSGHFVDEHGRVRFFRGVNSVRKSAPWFDDVIRRGERQRRLAEMGFNVVRLGAMWTGVQPASGSEVNESYVEVLEVSEFGFLASDHVTFH